MRLASHLIVAVAAYGAFATVTIGPTWHQDTTFWIALIFILIGAILPDLDHPESTVGRLLPILSYPLSAIFGHRGITHSAIMIIAIAGVSVYTNWEWVKWIAIGYGLHLLGDYLTDSGIPLFWPSKKRYRFVLVGSTGGLSEFVMVGLVIVVAGWFML